MTIYYGDDQANVYSGDEQSKGNAGVTAYKVFGSRTKITADNSTHTTSDKISLGKFRKGDRIIGFIISTSANLSAASLAIGNSGTAAKYKAAATLPNATSAFVPAISSALDDDPLDAEEELLCTISGATIPAGVLVIETLYAHR